MIVYREGTLIFLAVPRESALRSVFVRESQTAVVLFIYKYRSAGQVFEANHLLSKAHEELTLFQAY